VTTPMNQEQGWIIRITVEFFPIRYPDKTPSVNRTKIWLRRRPATSGGTATRQLPRNLKKCFVV